MRFVTAVLDLFLVIAILAFGIFWVDDGRPWVGAASFFCSGFLAGIGVVMFAPGRVFRRRRR